MYVKYKISESVDNYKVDDGIELINLTLTVDVLFGDNTPVSRIVYNRNEVGAIGSGYSDMLFQF